MISKEALIRLLHINAGRDTQIIAMPLIEYQG